VTIKSQKNDEYWRAVQLGLPLPPPKTPFIVDKFTTYLKGAGINMRQDGTILKALPLIDKEILNQSNGEITSPGVVKANDLSPEQSGLFDRSLTGGFDGTYWNHIELESTIPNPLMDDAIVGVLAPKLKKAEFNQLVNGTLYVTPAGELTTDALGNKTGGEGLRTLLKKIDVATEIDKARRGIKTMRGARRDIEAKRLRFLRALMEMNLKPEEAYLNKHISVIPAKFRPIYPNPDGSLNISDPIHGYREVIMINNQLKDLKKAGTDDKNLAPIRAQLYGAVRGLVGLQEPLTRNKNFSGFLSTIKGKQNKFGLFQGRVLKRRQDLSGRSTIIPDPKLGIDEVRIPDEMAFVIYKPYIMQKLRTLGFMPLRARELVEAKDPIARSALEQILKERPVILNRAPTLHKFGILAFKPTLWSGKAIQINPLVVAGFNADFDGDAMQVHVPVSEEARHEAMTKLVPSANLFSPRDNTLVHGPTKEMLLGVYLMTTPSGKPLAAKSYADVLAQYKAGKISSNQAMTVGSKTVCAGQIIFNDMMPEEVRPGYVSVDKKKLLAILVDIAKKKPNIAGQVISKVKDLGNHYVTEIGFSMGLKDLEFPYKNRDRIMAEAAAKTKTVGFAAAYGEAAKKLETMARTDLANTNRFVIGSMTSGAFGKSNEVMQTISTPVAVRDHEDKVIPIAIKNSLAEGLDIGSYWAIIPGSRKGLVDKGLATADTGAFGKELIAATIDTTITMKDCGTTDGIVLPVESPDALDRIVADGAYRGNATTPSLLRTMKSRGKKTVKVRSALHCKAQRGICSACFGPLENGQMPAIGYHIGTLAGQTISEPMTQLTLRTFHSGGTIGAGNTLGFPRLKQILEMPENVRGKATLAKIGGKVEGIKPSAAGGWVATVGGMSHFIPQEQGLGVRVGATVKAGDMLTLGGVVKPQELLEATNDIRRVQNRLIDDMNNEVFLPSNLRVKRKILETAIQPMTNRAEVSDPGDADVSFGVYTGDIVQLNKLDFMNKKLLAKNKKPIQYIPTLLSVRSVPQYHDDFIGQLVAERPHQTLKMAPSLAAKSDIGPDGHPIATYAFGKFFNTKVHENTKKTAGEIVEEIDEMTAVTEEPEPEPAPDLDDDVREALQGLMTTLGVIKPK
jgi:DNA-directed RNA polymerase subunit beta'